MLELIQALWNQMRADLNVSVAPQVFQAQHALQSATLGPLTEHQIEDLESIERSFAKLANRFEGEPINWADYSEAAHALRGPLNSTIGFSRLMLKGVEGPINQAQGEALKTIYGASQHMLALFNLLLDALLITTQDIGFNIEPLQAGEVLDELVTVGQALSDKLDFAFETDVIAPIAEITLHSDKKRLQQALSALLAIYGKRMNNNPLKLQVWTSESELLIQFQGQGVQLPAALPADLSRLLTDENDYTLPYDVHLRLGLTWRLLAEMGGRLETHQAKDVYTFTVALPLV
jgi:K+-sensing histidine kinase KdpD